MDHQMGERRTDLSLWDLRRSEKICREEERREKKEKVHNTGLNTIRELAKETAVCIGIFFAMATMQVIEKMPEGITVTEQWILSGSGITLTIYLLTEMIKIYEKRT